MVYEPLIYLAFAPALTVIVMAAGADSLSKPSTLRLAVYVSLTLLTIGVIVSVVTGIIGPAISATAPFAFLLWYQLAQSLFARVMGSPPVVNGPEVRDGDGGITSTGWS